MDDGDLDFSNPETYLCPSLGGGDTPGGCSMDSYFDDILKDTEHLACTHTHTCNPPARDLSHTHTCVHVHTKVVSASSDGGGGGADSPSAADTSASKKRRPSGNRAAVRKYREKKKAHTALLEEEVVHLKALNKQLMRKVQSHAALEAEVARLRCLLVDIRGRIEGEIGAFPYGRPVVPKSAAVDLVPGGSGVDLAGGAAAQVVSSCDFRCNDQLYCNPGLQQMRTMGDDGAAMFGQGAGDFVNVQCLGNAKSGSTMPPGCGGSVPSGCLPNSQHNK